MVCRALIEIQAHHIPQPTGLDDRLGDPQRFHRCRQVGHRRGPPLAHAGREIDQLIAQGTEILGSTPEEYAAYLRSELARWSKVVAETGAKAE